MKFRPIPILVTLVISFSVLFGGWSLYNSYALTNPMTDIISNIDGVNEVNTAFDADQVTIELTLDPNISIREVIQQIEAEGKSVINDREVTYHIQDDSNHKIDEWWSSSLFDVAQAMENKQYGDIPLKLEQQIHELEGLEVKTEIDDSNVYVQLKLDEHFKVIILPRTPAELEVW
ncbi:cation transporter [Chengkuizengella marina]|nr:cation transporter [Chengkuizengella marina]